MDYKGGERNVQGWGYGRALEMSGQPSFASHLNLPLVMVGGLGSVMITGSSHLIATTFHDLFHIVTNKEA